MKSATLERKPPSSSRQPDAIHDTKYLPLRRLTLGSGNKLLDPPSADGFLKPFRSKATRRDVAFRKRPQKRTENYSPRRMLARNPRFCKITGLCLQCSGTRNLGVAVLLLLIATAISARAAINISSADAQQIGKRIWQNECGGTISGLTSWNAGENFASLGIGHFIWYPKGERGPFEESFPKLVRFVGAHGAKLPQFLLPGHDSFCPWNSRAEFQQAINSPKMKQLRQFLVDTIDLQAEFLITRLQEALPKMLAQAADRASVQRQFDRVASSPQGCYALVDYVNFKGEGTLLTERYHGQGWGLLQVLENMHDTQSALDEFAASAKTMLRRRVANSPPERGEARWLPGWLARVDGYAK